MEKRQAKYSSPSCLICADCDRQVKGKRVCRLTNSDVSKEHFSLSSPDNCPKRMGAVSRG